MFGLPIKFQILTATKFIRRISTVISEITHPATVNAFLVGALVLDIEIAWFDTTGTQSHVVFITTITTVINSITQLVATYTTMVFTLESFECITTEVHWERNKQH